MKKISPKQQNAIGPHLLEFILGAIGVALIFGSTVTLVATGWSRNLMATEPEISNLKTDAPSLLDRRTKKFDYDPPEVGSYTLPKIRPAVDAEVIGPGFASVRLHELMKGRVTILSFDQSSSSNSEKCEVERGALIEVQRITREFPELADNVVMVTLRTVAIDSQSQQRERVKSIQLGHGRGADWIVISVKRDAELRPLLHAYSQHRDAHTPVDKRGSYSSSRVFVVDADLQVRNSYLHDEMDPRLVATDALTLLDEMEKN